MMRINRPERIRPLKTADNTSGAGQMEADNKPADRLAGEETARSKPVGVLERRRFNADFKLDWHDEQEAHDGYQLKWVGKSYARLETGTAPDTVLIPNAQHNSA
ncbi:MAG: hypothetical protein DU430_02465, partial [Candidatus Tokpelaia sp.]